MRPEVDLVNRKREEESKGEPDMSTGPLRSLQLMSVAFVAVAVTIMANRHVLILEGLSPPEK